MSSVDFILIKLAVINWSQKEKNKTEKQFCTTQGVSSFILKKRCKMKTVQTIYIRHITTQLKELDKQILKCVVVGEMSKYGPRCCSFAGQMGGNSWNSLFLGCWGSVIIWLAFFLQRWMVWNSLKKSSRRTEDWSVWEWWMFWHTTQSASW